MTDEKWKLSVQKENNLKNAKMSFPLGTFVAVTGVSGSGKSTMINEVLYKSLAQKLYKAKAKPGIHKEIKGLEHLDKVIDIDQSPIDVHHVLTQRLIQVCLMIFVMCLPKRMKRKYADIKRTFQL